MISFQFVNNVVIQDDTQVEVLMQSVETLGDHSVVVLTPVVDVFEPQRMRILVRPERNLTVEWRASNTAFHPQSSEPAWRSGRSWDVQARYWQVRVTVPKHAVLYRVELFSEFYLTKVQSTSFQI